MWGGDVSPGVSLRFHVLLFVPDFAFSPLMRESRMSSSPEIHLLLSPLCCVDFRRRDYLLVQPPAHWIASSSPWDSHWIPPVMSQR